MCACLSRLSASDRGGRGAVCQTGPVAGPPSHGRSLEPWQEAGKDHCSNYLLTVPRGVLSRCSQCRQ